MVASDEMKSHREAAADDRDSRLRGHPEHEDDPVICFFVSHPL